MHWQMRKYLNFSLQKFVQNLFFQPISPLEFAKCSVECGKGSSKERGLLGDLITGPIDLAQCIGKCVSIISTNYIHVQNVTFSQPISPLEFAKCSVECGKGSSKERGLLGDLVTGPIDFAQCIGKCVSISFHQQLYSCSKCFSANQSTGVRQMLR